MTPDVAVKIHDGHMEMRLPLAPSVDHLLFWMPKFRRPAPTTEADAYQESVLGILDRAMPDKRGLPLTGRLHVTVVVHLARNGRGDIQNREKALCDALTRAGVWEDDSQIDQLTMRRGVVIPGGAMDVTIEEATP
jgi:crossover junction endodeoxyribonuclease RusA